MGVIEPLSTLDWAAEEPRKIYKFSPKYFLTMGKLSPSEQQKYISDSHRSYEHEYKFHNPDGQTIPREND